MHSNYSSKRMFESYVICHIIGMLTLVFYHLSSILSSCSGWSWSTFFTISYNVGKCHLEHSVIEKKDPKA